MKQTSQQLGKPQNQFNVKKSLIIDKNTRYKTVYLKVFNEGKIPWSIISDII